MTILDTYDFLLRVAIPEILDNRKLPMELRWERGQRTVREEEPEYCRKKLVWECISRAHLDVLSGRNNVRDYFDGNIDSESGLNKFTLVLYQEITNNHTVDSERLIDRVLQEDNSRIGPTQKLVNMTLKYMFLLQLYGKLQGFNINEHECDCPLDSKILDGLGRSENKWTQDFNVEDGRAEYTIIQQEIQERRVNESKLSYDFANWQRFPGDQI